MGDLIRLLALDGPVVGAGVLLALAWLIARLESTRSENAAAHEGITRNVDDLRQQLTKSIDDTKQQLTKNIDDVEQQLTKNIDDVKQQLTKNIDDAKQQLTKNIDDVKYDVRDVKQDVRMLTAHLLSRKPSESDD